MRKEIHDMSDEERDQWRRDRELIDDLQKQNHALQTKLDALIARSITDAEVAACLRQLEQRATELSLKAARLDAKANELERRVQQLGAGS